MAIRRQPWCTYCGQTEEQVAARGDRLTGDHVVSKADGGADTADNYVTACGDCNSRKGRRSGIGWTGGITGQP